MPRLWFVTSVRESTRRLDGPFWDYDECQAACVKRADPETAARLLMVGKWPTTYVPRQFVVEIEVLAPVPHLYSPPAAPVKAAPKRGVTLPPQVYGYSRSALLMLCTALQLPAPRDGADRTAILAHIVDELGRLGGGRKVGR